MTTHQGFTISWNAPIIPSTSLAGIALNTEAENLEIAISSYLIDKKESLYKFENSPTLQLTLRELDESGNGGYLFSVSKNEISREPINGIHALSITIKNMKVFAVKVYSFGFPGEPEYNLIYQGTLPYHIGLGGLLSDLQDLTPLEFDDAEEWFYTTGDHEGLEVTGWGTPLEDHPDQIITAICVVQGTEQ